jgi:Na+/melibiose symporter-like transporter
MVAQYSIVADISDFDMLRTRRNRAGGYYALSAFLVKLGVAAGGGLGFVIVGIFGFEPNADNDTLAMTGFFLAFIVIPMGLYAMASALAWAFPIDKRRHDIIRRRLEQRRAPSTLPAPGDPGAGTA